MKLITIILFIFSFFCSFSQDLNISNTQNEIQHTKKCTLQILDKDSIKNTPFPIGILISLKTTDSLKIATIISVIGGDFLIATYNTKFLESSNNKSYQYDSLLKDIYFSELWQYAPKTNKISGNFISTVKNSKKILILPIQDTNSSPFEDFYILDSCFLNTIIKLTVKYNIDFKYVFTNNTVAKPEISVVTKDGIKKRDIKDIIGQNSSLEKTKNGYTIILNEDINYGLSFWLKTLIQSNLFESVNIKQYPL